MTMQQISFRAMGCTMLALLDAGGAQAEQVLAQVPGWFAEWEQQLSRFRPDSELSHFNRASGQTVHVSQTLWDVIDIALVGAQQSDGLVTPTLLDALEAAGYTQSWAEQPVESGRSAAQPSIITSTSTIKPILSQAWQLVERDPQTMAIRSPAGVRFDLGGVAKGWAADQAAQRLSAYGPALVDAGGDIAVSGPRVSGEYWQIDVANPFLPESDLATLQIKKGGVATSGRDYRRWQRDGQEYHHIIDPRTNAPAQTDVLSATVVAPTAFESEIGAKAALILGSTLGRNWLEARPTFAGLLVLENGDYVATKRLRVCLERGV